MTRKPGFALAYRLPFALIGWFGVIGHLVQKLLNRPPEWSIPYTVLDFFSYYTIQSNILVLLWLSTAIFTWRREKAHPLLRPKVKGAFTLYISLTCIVYAILLAKLWNPEGVDRYLTVISHYITPIAFMLDWILFEKRETYKWNYAIQWLIYPLAYLVYDQIYGAITGRYLYPFLNVPEIGWTGLAGRVAVLTLVYIVLGCFLIAINKIWKGGQEMEPAVF